MLKLAKGFTLAKDDEMSSLEDGFLDYRLSPSTELPVFNPDEACDAVRHRIVVEMAQMKTGIGSWALLVLVLCCLPYSNADNGGVFSIVTKVTDTRPDEDVICALCKLRCKLNIGEECRQFQPSMLCGITCRPTSPYS